VAVAVHFEGVDVVVQDCGLGDLLESLEVIVAVVGVALCSGGS
jgi:hypothetical protein